MKHISVITLAVFAMATCSPADKPSETPAPASAPASSTPAPPPAADASNPPAASTAEDACGKAKYADLVGKPATDPAVPPASPSVRHITPGMQVTMDFRADRLNIRIGVDGKITEISCG